MKFRVNEDIEAGQDEVFAAFTDFEHFERMALRHGAEVVRTDDGGRTGGPSWQVSAPFRGRRRRFQVTLAEMTPPDALRFEAVGDGLEMSVVLEFLQLSRRRTRVTVLIELRPKTLPARLVVHSARLARKAILRRLRRRFSQLARRIEARVVERGRREVSTRRS
ncbi:MAG: SRPBCC family protein [Alphaproteobacteria bacterium]|nr:MAG: SRPBCC family protein [Alphaproteobacteria bacterium]